MKKIILVICLVLLCSASVFAAASDNYLGLRVNDFALALKDFDAIAPAPGSSEFSKPNSSGDISPRFLLAVAMQNGWDITFDEAGISNNALLIFCNAEKNTTVLALAQKADAQLQLSWYYNGNKRSNSFQSVESAESRFNHKFIGAINPSKHTMKWGSQAAYSDYFSPPNVSYAFRLYEKYSSPLRLSGHEYGWTEIMSSMATRGMPSTTRASSVKAGALVNIVGRNQSVSENGNILFIIHVDTKSDLIYYTYYGDKPYIDVMPFSEFQSRMKMGILPEKEVADPILF